MAFHTPPTEQQGFYRYNPVRLKQGGAARIFPHIGEDGIWRYILTELVRNLSDRGQLSEPLILLLKQLEEVQKTLQKTWGNLTTLLANWEFLNSGWLNVDLPPGEQFNTSYGIKRRDTIQIMLAAVEAAQKESKQAVNEGVSSRQQSDRQRSEFYQVLEQRGLQSPRVRSIYERDGGLSDREFARQRLAGANPMIIRRIRESDRPLLQTWSNLPCNLENGQQINLVDSAAENRLFIADYPLLENITPAQLQPARYVGNPQALFYRGDRGLEPLLIQLQTGGKVFQPHNDENVDDWMRAKLYVQVADITHHELIDHLCYTHLIMEAFAIATPRQLPSTHPVYRLLSPHLRFLLAINGRVEPVLLGEDAAIGKLMSQTREASLQTIELAFRQRAFEDYALPNNIKQRGIELDFLPEFPYRDDAQLLWEAIARYVKAYLQRYYPEDRAVQQDPYLQAWAAELGLPLDSRPLTDFPQVPDWLPSELVAQTGLLIESLPHHPRIPNFPEHLSSLQQLIDICTQIIFTSGPQHAAVNFSQFDYLGYVPNAPLGTYARPDVTASVDEMLPSPNLDLEQTRISFVLSEIRWSQLGSSEVINFADAGDLLILEQFQSDLQEIESQIQSRNQQRRQESGVDYPYLLPSQIPNSINV